MVNRGYSSCTAMHDAFRRFQSAEAENKDGYILYLGDHDPSGLDMVRDINNRIQEFGVSPEVNHIAITKQQIEKYNPPPNPAKISDPRAGWYISEHGDASWEVDALEPKILHKLLKKNIESLIDMKLFKAQIRQENEDKLSLQAMMEG